MGTDGIPLNYLIQNEALVKNPVIVVKIKGLNDILSSTPVGTEILYGDVDVIYGAPGLVYGGLRPYTKQNEDGSISTFRPYLNLDGSSLTIGQRLEPEQGKASVSLLTLSFIDYEGFMTQLISPGVLLPEILGAEIQVFLGFSNISYPQDFFEVFRGYISAVDDGPGTVNIQVSDPNIKRRQQLFYIAQSSLTGDISPSDTSIPVTSTGDFFAPIIGPDGNPNNSVHCFIQIDDEWIECVPDSGTTFSVIMRGARGTTADSHTSGTTVSAGIQIGDPTYQVNALDMALQFMLSGWDGPWITGEPLLAIGPEPDPDPGTTTTDFITLPSGVDAVQDYGLVAGEWCILQGSSHGGNNNTLFQIVRFADFESQSNRLIYVNATLTKEQDTPATIGFRSQYDVLPVGAGLSLTPIDVDIAQHQLIKNIFLGGNGNDYIFFFSQSVDSGKDFLETQVYFPIGAYSLTRRGKLSCGYHSPPIANQNLAILNKDNVLDPQNIRPSRALNQRAFFNEIDISYNFDDAGDSLSNVVILDNDSLNAIGITSVLPISAQGVYAGYSAAKLQKRAFFLLNRYKRGALMFTIKVNWKVGSTIEAGDIVTIQDYGNLQLANFNTGERGLDYQLFEVIDRTFDLKAGNVSLKLVGGLGATIQDRFATISPSSHTDTGCTSQKVIIKDSFGALYPGNESKKWAQYIGLPIVVHSKDWTVYAQVTLLSIDATNNYLLHVTDLGFTPPADYVVDIAAYPNSPDPTENALYKVMHVFLSPTVLVTSGTDTTHFDVGGGDIGKFKVGAPVRIHSLDYSSDSGDLTVAGIVGTTIQTSASMGFTPSAGFQVDLIGFPDFNPTTNTGQPYRLI